MIFHLQQKSKAFKHSFSKASASKRKRKPEYDDPGIFRGYLATPSPDSVNCRSEYPLWTFIHWRQWGSVRALFTHHPHPFPCPPYKLLPSPPLRWAKAKAQLFPAFSWVFALALSGWSVLIVSFLCINVSTLRECTEQQQNSWKHLALLWN